MILNIFIEDQSYPVEVPEEIVMQAGDYFQTLDQDMDCLLYTSPSPRD